MRELETLVGRGGYCHRHALWALDGCGRSWGTHQAQVFNSSLELTELRYLPHGGPKIGGERGRGVGGEGGEVGGCGEDVSWGRRAEGGEGGKLT